MQLIESRSWSLLLLASATSGLHKATYIPSSQEFEEIGQIPSVLNGTPFMKGLGFGVRMALFLKPRFEVCTIKASLVVLVYVAGCCTQCIGDGKVIICSMDMLVG